MFARVLSFSIRQIGWALSHFDRLWTLAESAQRCGTRLVGPFFLYFAGLNPTMGIEDNAIRTPRYATLVNPFSMSSSTVNGFLVF